MPGNIVRGGLGNALRAIACVPNCPGFSGKGARQCESQQDCAYARIFEPAASDSGPSGLADPPRPFVIRAAHLNSQTISPGEPFFFDVNLFETRRPLVGYLERAFQALGLQGLGPGRGRAELISVEQLDQSHRVTNGPPISISVQAGSTKIQNLRIAFRTPTELKGDGKPVAEPEFAILFARARDRVSTLRALYGGGSLDLDFQALGERANAVRMTRCDLQHVKMQRQSSRTRQSHGLGGFIGAVEYEGDLTEFLPILKAAQWTGVGRHCVWGNGELCLETIDPV